MKNIQTFHILFTLTLTLLAAGVPLAFCEEETVQLELNTDRTIIATYNARVLYSFDAPWENAESVDIVQANFSMQLLVMNAKGVGTPTGIPTPLPDFWGEAKREEHGFSISGHVMVTVPSVNYFQILARFVLRRNARSNNISTTCVVEARTGRSLYKTPLPMFPTDDCPTPGLFGRGNNCKPCPLGATCPGGNRVWALPGFWVIDPLQVKQCHPPEACTGGAMNLCSEGYAGKFCSNCAAGFVRVTGLCLKDSNPMRIYIPYIIILVGIFPLLSFGFFLGRDGSLRTALPCVMFIFRTAQIIAFLSISPRGPWSVTRRYEPGSFTETLFAPFTGLPEFFVSSHLKNIGVNPVITLLVSMPFLLMYSIPFGIVVVILWRWPSGFSIANATDDSRVDVADVDPGDVEAILPSSESTANEIPALSTPVLAKRALVCTFSLMFLPILAIAGSTFACDSSKYMLNYPSFECGKKEHLASAGIGFAIFVAAVGFMWKIVRQALQLRKIDDVDYAFLFGHYRPGFWRTKMLLLEFVHIGTTVLYWTLLASTAGSIGAIKVFGAIITVIFLASVAFVGVKRPLCGITMNASYVLGQIAIIFGFWTAISGDPDSPRWKASETSVMFFIFIATWIGSITLALHAFVVSSFKRSHIASSDINSGQDEQYYVALEK